ncbi:MAG: hypothetical protein J0L81_09030 [Caulobacterales bacterium]|jgi:uncharacterized phiE125 gp8 family phage protein|nr:hypothetical protein [Caulobacterales bacterium]
MTLTLITASTAEPVTLEELRAFGQVDHTDDDALLECLAVAAREFVESSAGVALPAQTWELAVRDWPSRIIKLPRPPLQAVESLKHRDAAGNLVTLAENTDYRVDLAGGAVEPVSAWPRVGDYSDAVQLRFTAGYAGADDVPQRAKLAIMSLAAFWYDHRNPAEPSDGATRRVPFHVKAMLAQLRGGRLEAVA